MLKGIDAHLAPDLLWVLAKMGHGDDLMVVDANFPAASLATFTKFRQLIPVTALTIGALIAKILTIFPLDNFVPTPVLRMENVDDPAAIPEAQQSVIDLVGAHQVGSLERFAFYEAAKQSCAIVHLITETRPYGCFVLKKGVVFSQS